MADELDPRLEASLRAALHHEADQLPLLVRVEDIERARRQRGRRRLALPASLLAAAAVIAVLVVVAGAWRANESLVATSPSPSGSAPATSTPPLAAFAALEALLAGQGADAPLGVAVRGEHPVAEEGDTPVRTSLGTVEIPAVVGACLGEPIQVGVRQADGSAVSTLATCDGEPFVLKLGATGDVWVQASPGVRWRVVVGAGAVAGPTQPVDGCAQVTAATHAHRPVVVRDTFAEVEKGEGLVVWSGDGEPPNTAATWDDSAGQGEYAAFHGVSTFQLDARASCLAGWRIEYAPVDSVEASRASGAAPGDAAIAVEGSADVPAHTVDFDLPDRGHYVVRATLTWLLEDGSIGRDVRLWRLWTDAVEYYPDVPHPDPVAPCGAPDLAQPAPPALALMLDGNRVAAGVLVNGRWDGTLATGGPTEVPAGAVPLPSGSGLVLEVGGDVCAMGWTVTYGPVPVSLEAFEPAGETLALQGNPTLDPAYARENHISLGDLPPGEWIVQAVLVFPDGGSRTWFRVIVGG